MGVVHAVIRRDCPSACTIDLTHAIAPYDVRAGALALARVLPHLGPGVVLAVVDPGVGSTRRPVSVQAADDRWFVGPDNGLLAPVLEASGGARRALALQGAATRSSFDGRDIFAPAAAALAGGREAEALGVPIDPASLGRLDPPLAECSERPDGRWTVRTEVLWVDRFGNVQLALPAEDSGTSPTELAVPADGPREAQWALRRVGAFSELRADELGLMGDANGHLALVRHRASAADLLGLGPGDRVELIW